MIKEEDEVEKIMSGSQYAADEPRESMRSLSESLGGHMSVRAGLLRLQAMKLAITF